MEDNRDEIREVTRAFNWNVISFTLLLNFKRHQPLNTNGKAGTLTSNSHGRLRSQLSRERQVTCMYGFCNPPPGFTEDYYSDLVTAPTAKIPYRLSLRTINASSVWTEIYKPVQVDTTKPHKCNWFIVRFDNRDGCVVNDEDIDVESLTQCIFAVQTSIRNGIRMCLNSTHTR